MQPFFTARRRKLKGWQARLCCLWRRWRPWPFRKRLPLRASESLSSIGGGNTIRVRQAGKAVSVRLACIDAPEAALTPYGQEVRRYLQQRLPIGREVSLDIKTTDRYGRTVAEVFRNGQNVNLAMVSSVVAFAYWKYLSACDGSAYLGAEATAPRNPPARRGPCWRL